MRSSRAAASVSKITTQSPQKIGRCVLLPYCRRAQNRANGCFSNSWLLHQIQLSSSNETHKCVPWLTWHLRVNTTSSASRGHSSLPVTGQTRQRGSGFDHVWLCHETCAHSNPRFGWRSSSKPFFIARTHLRNTFRDPSFVYNIVIIGSCSA